MRIQNINNINITTNYTKPNNANHYSKEKKSNFVKEIPLSNNYYKPTFGNQKKYNKSIEDFLNSDKYEDSWKNVLKKLLKIPYFENAAMGMKEDDLSLLISNVLFFEPVFEDVLKGKYVAIFPNSEVEKPVFDLKSLAEYNKKHIENPKDINEEFALNPLAMDLIYKMKLGNLKELPFPLEFVHEIDEEDFTSTVKYKPAAKVDFKKQHTQIDKKDFKAIQNAAPSESLEQLLTSNSLNNKKKKTLWELTQIPFFNASVNNLSEDEIKDIVDYVEIDKAFLTETFKRNITIKDTVKNESKPLIDIASIAINNQLKPDEQVSLYDELITNDLFTNVMNRSRLLKSLNGKYPLFFIAHDPNAKILGTPTKVNTMEKAKQAIDFIMNNEKLHKMFPYLVVFENDLNKVEKELNIEKKSLSNKEKTKLEISKQAKTPKSFMNFFGNEDIDKRSKQIAYNLSEKPYISALMQNSTENDVADLVFLKRNYSSAFENIMSGKTKIIESNNEFQAKPLIDLEELVLSDTKLNEVMSFNTFNYDICKEIGEYQNKLGKNIARIIYNKLFDGMSITVQDIEGNTKIFYKEKTLPQSIKKHVENNDPNSQKFSIYTGVINN